MVARLLGLLDAVVCCPLTQMAKEPCLTLQQLKNGGSGQSELCLELITSPLGLLSALVTATSGLERGVSGEITSTKRCAEVPFGAELVSVSFLVLHMITRAARQRLDVLHQALAGEGARAEFQFVCDRLLTSFTQAVANVSGEGSHVHVLGDSRGDTEAALAELVTLLGYFCLGNEQHQDMLLFNHPHTLLLRLCSLPFRYFTHDHLKDVLFPALIAACLGNEPSRALVEREVSAELLATYLAKHLQEREASEESAEPAGNVTPSQWIKLSHRLPAELWDDAFLFLTEQVKSY
ncbi:unnamed protein product [Chrysoparadoxa australica]